MAYLESKPRYEILDGLRGVAAFMVIAFHLIESYQTPSLSNTYFTHGYLAVDFFFALSGFVMGYAYDDRWGKMSIGDFFKRRIIRLHPMVIFGAMVGVCFFYYSGDFEMFGKVDEAQWWMLLLQAVLLICMIPLPSSMDIRGWGELTSINGPEWTLMFEYVANIFYALFFRHLGKIALAVLVALSAIMTADCCLHLNLFGLLESNWNSYSVVGGFLFNPEHIYIGYTRLLYPFLVGLLLSRIGRTIKVGNGFAVASLVIVVLMCMPKLGGDEKIIDGIYQMFCILIMFPIVLLIGAGSSLKGRNTNRLCVFLGKISFPIYITHYPLIYMHMSWVQRHLDAPLGTHILVAISTLLIAIALAWSALKLYDEPVREWLKNKLLRK